MPHADPQERAEYFRNYKLLHADAIKQAKKKYANNNKEKIRLANKTWKEANKDKVREVQRNWWEANKQRIAASKYGLTVEQYQELVEATNGVCLICGVELVFDKKCAAQACLDHDHDTGKVRGIICNRCNLLIGKAKDSPELLRKAAEYLEGK